MLDILDTARAPGHQKRRTGVSGRALPVASLPARLRSIYDLCFCPPPREASCCAAGRRLTRPRLTAAERGHVNPMPRYSCPRLSVAIAEPKPSQGTISQHRHS